MPFPFDCNVLDVTFLPQHAQVVRQSVTRISLKCIEPQNLETTRADDNQTIVESKNKIWEAI